MTEKADQQRNGQREHEEQEFFSIEQLAARWGCSGKHVRRLIDRGDLVAHKFGNLVRISKQERTRYERLSRQD